MASSGPAALRRSWRRFRRRSAAVQVVALILVIAVVGGAVYGITASTKKTTPNAAAGSGGQRQRGCRQRVGAGQAQRRERRPGVDEQPGRQRHVDQRGIPGVEPHVAGVELRVRGRHRIRGAEGRHPHLRQRHQRCGRHQRPQGQSHHRELRSHQRSRPCGRCASSGPRALHRCSPCSTGSARGPVTTSCASPKKATPPSSGNGRR